jgi:hypothetical protein
MREKLISEILAIEKFGALLDWLRINQRTIDAMTTMDNSFIYSAYSNRRAELLTQRA